MKTIEVKVYQYSELSDKAKVKARRWWIDGEDFTFDWDCLKEDAKTVGLELKAWEHCRYLKAEFIVSARDCAEKIVQNHGKKCETYKTAKRFLADLRSLSSPDSQEQCEIDFKNDIQEDYRILADKEYEYQQSEEAISEAMTANEYEFLEDGKRFWVKS